MEQERVSCLALPQADNALKGHADVVGLHVRVQGVEGSLEPTVDALPLPTHLGPELHFDILTFSTLVIRLRTSKSLFSFLSPIITRPPPPGGHGTVLAFKPR